MIIIGISAFYHDSAVCLLVDGHIRFCIQEERLSRVKHDERFPEKAIEYIFNNSEFNIQDIDYVVFYDKPLLKFERLLETYITNSPRGFKSFAKAMPIWIKQKLFLKNFIFNWFRKYNPNFQEKQIKFSEHHLSHAASAFFPSPFKESVILTMDGVGEWATSSICFGKSNNIEILKEINFPHSLGLLYSAFTQYCGFKVNSGEYKLMGLAPYGKPRFIEIIKDNLLDIKEDGSFRLNMKYFNYMTGLSMTNKYFEDLFGMKVRKPESIMDQFYIDIAASIQSLTEEILFKIVSNLSKTFRTDNLCLAGGVALNCVATGKLENSKIFKNIWIQPAAGDAGGALGAALTFWHDKNGLNKARIVSNNTFDSMQGSYLGSSFTNKEIEKILLKNNINFIYLSKKEKTQKAAEFLKKGKFIGWFQGRMEFGPRALGNRSILANPLLDSTQKSLNLKIKYRESFRPFAPAILYEEVDKWFIDARKSQYMSFVKEIKKDKRINLKDKDLDKTGKELLYIKRSIVPAITHVDYSARIQTVHKETNSLFYDLINQFYKITNCPILVNTSFNVRGQPIVCSPNDALECFFGTDLDYLFIGDYMITKKENNHKIINNFEQRYLLD